MRTLVPIPRKICCVACVGISKITTYCQMVAKGTPSIIIIIIRQQADLQRVVTVTRDPLAIAERGKVGIPSSHSECSSNDSIEASVDSHTGILTGDGSGRALPVRNSYNKSQRYQHKVDVLPQKMEKDRDSVEPLFDTSDLRSIKSDDILVTDSKIIAPRGPIELEMSLLYDAPMRKMTVHVMQARCLPPLGNGQQTHTQVRMLMLPNKKQKHKTKIRSGENPQYMESFLLHRVNPEDVNNMGLRVRLYGCERLRKERLIGEAYVSFATVDLELETNLWLPLEPRNTSSLLGSTSDLLSLARSDSAGSTSSMQHGGVSELLLGLSYNGVTGRLSVEIIKGSQFRSLTLNKAPDTYVKMCMVSSIGQEISRAKTSIRRGPNPLFKETFAFQVALFQLNDVTLMISVYAKRHMKKNEMVGWFSMGLNSSGPEECAHWTDLGQSTGRGSKAFKKLSFAAFKDRSKQKSPMEKDKDKDKESNGIQFPANDNAVAVDIEPGLELDFV
ncbi:hypothetical protein ACLKA6_018918 [Drosophila palustris]